RELLDQVFVRLAENIGLDGLVPEVDPREVLEQIPEQGVGKTVLIGPSGVAEDAVERLRVSLLDPAHGFLKRLSDVSRNDADIIPVATLGNLKPVVLRKNRVLFIASRFTKGGRVLLMVHVRDAFEKKKWENVGLEIGGVNRAAKD